MEELQARVIEGNVLRGCKEFRVEVPTAQGGVRAVHEGDSRPRGHDLEVHVETHRLKL